MINSRSILILALLCIASVAWGQGEELRALSTRPNGEQVRQKDGVDRVFVYEYVMQDIPLMDDFS
ncbi:MAG: hypothetical protein IT224_02450, partial [Flavobacteriales bacterium]|nr:hypothetical protein [Flavobacteriales bacterium]